MKLPTHLAFALTCLLLCACAPEGGRQPALTDTTRQSGAPRAPEQIAVVLEKVDLQLRIDPAQRGLQGDAALTLLAKSPIARVVLDLDRNLPVESVAVDGRALPASAWRNPEGRLLIDLPAPLPAGQRTTVRIVYGGKPHVAQRAPWDGGFVWSQAPTGEPWIATAVQGEGCDLFWPCIDHPQGEPLLVVQHITVPTPLVAAGNGVAMGMDEADGWRTWHWRIRNPNTYAIALNIGPYELLSGDYASRFGNTIPLRFWYLRGNANKARELFAELPIMLDFFESAIGPYPFAEEKLGIVETPHLGMEHQTINAYGNRYSKGPYGFDWLLQHELAHEWFGNQLTNANWDDMWLHEGFGSYMQPLYMQYLRGDMAYYAQLHEQRVGVVNAFPIVSGKPMLEHEVYSDEHGPGGDIYVKGSLVLHSLRELIGDEAFFGATRRLVYGTDRPRPGNFAPRYGSTREFIALVNDETGQDYGWFFDAYLYQAQLPELSIVRDGDELRLSWKTAGGTPFPMSVEVRVGDRVDIVPMDDGRGNLMLSPDASFTIDPYSKLLQRLPHVEAYQQFQEESEDKSGD